MSKSWKGRHNLNLFRDKAVKRGFDCSKVWYSDTKEQWEFTITGPTKRDIFTISFADSLRLELKAISMSGNYWLLPSWEGWREYLAALELTQLAPDRLSREDFNTTIKKLWKEPESKGIQRGSSFYEAIENTFHKLKHETLVIYMIYCDLV